MPVDFAFEIEGALFVGKIARCEERGEGDPEEEVVDGEEGAVVEEDACPADERGEDSHRCSESGDGELSAVADADDICVLEDVEPGEKTEDERRDGIEHDLRDSSIRMADD